jgi:NADH-quinone oxidoreductase subunit L
MIPILLIILLFLPLLGALAIGGFAKGQGLRSARIGIAAALGSFGASLLIFRAWQLDRPSFELVLPWLKVGALTVDFGFRLDLLSVLMTLVVTGVGSIIHIYSWGYMRADRDASRYFASLNFFLFAMLGIVLANNFVQMFVFWELVGLASYLLIGFWYERPAAADAAKKAFLTNRLGDVGFFAGILMLWAQLNTVHFGALERLLTANPRALGTLTAVIGLLVFCGAVGKSAQFPLHVWLPDAMEGPTPVSALIHAATMVAAGVYLVCRVFILLSLPGQWPAWFPWPQCSVLEIIAWIGALTALMAALIALQQDDIKRILAYSTLSQLGYMFLAVGVGGPTAAMFHLTTHAFFKALLFLGAGSVIVALHHQQDIWKMGALSQRLPITFWTFLIGTLALCGVPPLSGFFSKDAILAVAFHQNKALFAIAVLIACLTAFYMFRLVWVAFLGSSKSHEAGHAQESPLVMTGPLVLLAIPAALAGFWGIEGWFGRFFAVEASPHGSWLSRFVEPFQHAPVPAMAGLMATGIGFILAYGLYGQAKIDPLPARLGVGALWLRRKFYWDELYQALISRTQDQLAQWADVFDRWIIAGLVVRGLHGTVELSGRVLRLAQTGQVQTYAFWFVLGVCVLFWWLLG